MTTSKKHPAKFSDHFIPIFAHLLRHSSRVYDPMAGTGKIAKIKEFGYQGDIYCTELEPEWIIHNKYITHWHIGDASNVSFIKSAFFDAICTSPTYGNRVADHFDAYDASRRITYRHYLGRPLHANNTGRMQWGKNTVKCT